MIVWQGLAFALSFTAVFRPSAAEVTFDINLMRVGLEVLAGYYSDWQDFEGFTEPVPFLGKSINELVSGDPEGGQFTDVLDFTNFIARAIAKLGTHNLSATQIKDELTSFIKTSAVEVAGAGNIADHSMCDVDSDPITIAVDGASGQLVATFCARLSYARQAKFDGSGLFSSIPDSYDIIANADMSFRVGLDLGASLSISASAFNNPVLTISPVEASISMSFSPSLLFMVGTLALSAEATGTVDASFTLIYCQEGSYSDCKSAYPEAEPLLVANSGNSVTSKIYFQKGLSYELSGNLELAMELSGFDIGVSASFQVEEPDAFNPNPSKSFDDCGRAAIRCFDCPCQLTHPH
jgi:hypothetical protein